MGRAGWSYEEVEPYFLKLEGGGGGGGGGVRPESSRKYRGDAGIFSRRFGIWSG